jgi:hypothetical protein
MLTIKDLVQTKELDSAAMSAVRGGHGRGHAYGNNNNNSGILVGGDNSGVIVGGDVSGTVQNGDGNISFGDFNLGDKSKVRISL